MGYEKLFQSFLHRRKVRKHWCRLWVVVWDSVNQFTISGPLPAYYPRSSAGYFSTLQSCQGRKLTTHFNLLLRLRTSGPVSLLPLGALMVCKANITIYLHNKGRNGLVTLNPLLPFTLLERTSKDGSSLISGGEDSTRHLHAGFRFVLNVLNLA